jgi:hypothetical protein
MTTRATMLAEMADDMERTADASFTAKINAAIRHYQPRRFSFNESRSVTFNTVASTDTYSFTTIGTEFYKIDGVFVTIAADDIRELTLMNYRGMEVVAGNMTDTGEPSDYALIPSGIRLWRNPDAIYSTRLLGHVKLAAPATDGEADNAWMTDGYDLIMSRAKSELYAHRFEDPNNAAIMRAAEFSALAQLMSARDDKTSDDHLEATEF